MATIGETHAAQVASRIFAGLHTRSVITMTLLEPLDRASAAARSSAPAPAIALRAAHCAWLPTHPVLRP